jgi:hypothetical protein
MKPLRLLLFLLLGGLSLGFSQNCQTASSIPSDLAKVASGTATADYDGTSSIKGGQAVYVRVKNENALGVSYEVVVAEDTKPVVTNCTYKALLPPKTSAVIWGALFAEPPVGWKITVSVGPESDAGVLGYEVYSNPKKDSAKR